MRKLLISLSAVSQSQINGDGHIIGKTGSILTWQKRGFRKKVLVGVDNIQTNRARISNSDIGT